MLIDWTSDFDRMLTGLETRAEDGDSEATAQLEVINSQLAYLQALTEPPTDDTAVLKRVRQSRNNPVWRLSHPFRPGFAVRLIVWFPPDDPPVIVLFGADKARMGDVFYDSVGRRADQIIDKLLRERKDDAR